MPPYILDTRLYCRLWPAPLCHITSSKNPCYGSANDTRREETLRAMVGKLLKLAFHRIRASLLSFNRPWRRVMQINKSYWRSDPSQREIAALMMVTAVLFVCTVVRLQNYASMVNNFGDSSAYTEIASAIQHWDFRGLHIKQFWGYPYAMAAASIVTHLPVQGSLLLISFASSFVAIVLAYRLWGGWVAALFAVLNFDWMQRSFLGGSEPLAVALIFGALVLVRKDRYVLASLLAALSTV